MKNIKETCIDFLSNDDTKKEIIHFLRPLTDSIYNELYIYLWVICFFCIVLFIVSLANLFLLLKIFNKTTIIDMQYVN
jgi:hypothetical protein